MTTETVTALMLRSRENLIDEHGRQRCEIADCAETFTPAAGKRWHADACGSLFRQARSVWRGAAELTAVAQDLDRFAAFEPSDDHEPAPFETLTGAKLYLNDHADEGATCPCCGQRVQIYRRPITSSSAAMLILAVTEHGDRLFHQPTLERLAGFAAGDWAKLRYWGLIEESQVYVGNQPRAGWWTVTPRGALFVGRGFVVPRYAVIFNSQLLRLEGPPTSIVDALGTRFDYGEVVQRGIAQAATRPD